MSYRAGVFFTTRPLPRTDTTMKHQVTETDFLRLPVSIDIAWLLKQGRHLGVSTKLASKLDYVWRSCTGELSVRRA